MRLKYKLGLAIVVVMMAICLITYQSYALWIAKESGQENIVEVGCFEVEFQELNAPIKLSNTYPVSDAKGLSGTPYSFKITNKCSIASRYSITLNTLLQNTITVGNETLNLKEKIKFALHEKSKTKPVSGENLGTYSQNPNNINKDLSNLTIENLDESIILATDILNENKSAEFDLYLWFDETAGNEVMSQKFEASVNIVSTAAVAKPSIEDAIISQLDTTGACPVANEEGVVTITKAETSASLLCSAPDDYGVSYYYRGTPTNNYVKYAGFYWRILRINGDGSVRLVYVGNANTIDSSANKETILANGYSGTDIHLSASFSGRYYGDSIAYVGYKYGSTSSSVYEEIHQNTTDSNIKKAIDTWYQNNMSDYTDQLSDTLFCNDRSMVSDSFFRAGSNINSKVTLKCAQQNDRFTVSDTTTGNGALTYPIAIPTADEYLLAGVRDGSYNKTFYLYAAGYTVTMTPAYVSTANSRYQPNMNMISANGNISQSAVNWESDVIMKPVINLKRGVLTSGTGTMNDPYMAS